MIEMLYDIDQGNDVEAFVGVRQVLELTLGDVEPEELARQLGGRRGLNPVELPAHPACHPQEKAAVGSDVEQLAARLESSKDSQLLAVVGVAIVGLLAPQNRPVFCQDAVALAVIVLLRLAQARADIDQRAALTASDAKPE